MICIALSTMPTVSSPTFTWFLSVFAGAAWSVAAPARMVAISEGQVWKIYLTYRLREPNG
ncbi:MAG: hypothetical protein NDJ92_10520 [Thermoanaerobaculia bacterium]|nr:hypothetical protein [Thermoanaerobaculia bacterium]